MRDFSFITLILLMVAFMGACASTPQRSPQSEEAMFVQPHLVPDAVYSRMIKIANTQQPDKEKLQAIFDSICNGKQPRFLIKKEITYTHPDTSGMPLDDALAKRGTYLQRARRFFKEYYLYETSGNYHTGAYFERDEKEIDDWLRETYLRKHDDTSLLFDLYSFKIPLAEIARLNGIKRYSDETYANSTDVQYLGFDPHTHRYSERKAIDNRDSMWLYVLRKSTELVEAPQPNNSIKFLIKFDLGLFCQYGIPVTSLLSE